MQAQKDTRSFFNAENDIMYFILILARYL
jgi:hypothetical protein